MSIILGIDTGGTYTDSVIFDKQTKQILSSFKTLTTHENLLIGIEKAISQIPTVLINQINGIVLSTTLGTNAAVEEKGGSVGLICIGPEIKETLPADLCFFINGGHDVEGNEIAKINPSDIADAIDQMKGKVDAVAISGIFSVRNPSHEMMVKDAVKKQLELPVVCGHEITSSLDYPKRTLTALLNCKLLPVINSLISDLKKVLASHNIHAKLMILKGDGTVISEGDAMAHPVETILSGPAASIVGASVLTNLKDFIVVDIGGTTTDIAMVKDGKCLINDEGATVGNWQTKVKAVNVVTYGLGGDSEIAINHKKQITIGPRRIYPISFITDRYPHLLLEFKRIKQTSHRNISFNDYTAYVLVKSNRSVTLSQIENDVIQLLQDGPHCLYYLAEKLTTETYKIHTQKLENLGIIKKTGLTPTDILHAKGEYMAWNRDGVDFLLDTLCEEKYLNRGTIADEIFKEIERKGLRSVVDALFKFDNSPMRFVEDHVKSVFFDQLFLSGNHLSLSLSCHLPIVAIGAPAKAYTRNLEKDLGTQLIVPEQYSVANAVGAANSMMVKKIKGIVRSLDEGFACYLPWARTAFEHYEESVIYCENEIRASLQSWLSSEKLLNQKTDIMIKEHFVNPEDRHVLIETEICGEVFGNPAF
ncbi:MAG: hydantoinase/oxoprolinase family protein [Tissierellales bacterium]|nr:hydantoinase/oxoprolinase family protein [Tissierellales bacterium]MBN2826527.1 hydantoinase/oxoprolinase family protein [Tissierellales bacterium]